MTNIWICEMYIFIPIRKTFVMFIHIGIQKTWNWFRYKTFNYLFEFKVFRHEERERQFLSILTFPSDQTTCGTLQTTGLASASSENRLASSKPKSQLTGFFSNPKILSPSLPSMTTFTSPSPISYLGDYCDICDCHILHMWTSALNVCT